MSTVIRLPEKLYKRLEKYATGFDTPVQVIEKILNQIEGIENAQTENDTIGSSLLTIKLNPSDVEDFKQELLEKRSAKITIYYLDGSSEIKSWKANRFTKESDVIGNLRSRKEFRQGAWQERGIQYISVSV
ncbi:MAG: hypothetical protein AB7S81_03595 [Bdellovibrionales bacterium]